MRPFENGYALVMGVAGLGYHCSDQRQLKPLPLSVLNDAVDLARTLWNPDFCGYRADRVRLLLEEQATAQGILAGFDWLSDCCQEEDTAIIFFSGHGWRKERSSESYLVAYDAWRESPPGGLISGNLLTQRFRAIRAGRLAVFLDCCFAGSLGEVKGGGNLDGLPYGFRSGLGEGIYAGLGQGKGRAILASSLGNEESIVAGKERNSLFTDCLIRGFRGEAERPGAATIGVYDLAEFVKRQVLSHSGERQHPVLKGEFQDNFPIALRASKKTAETTTEQSPREIIHPNNVDNTVKKIKARDIGIVNM
jgi:uncharacterized caspase-like protein